MGHSTTNEVYRSLEVYDRAVESVGGGRDDIFELVE